MMTDRMDAAEWRGVLGAIEGILPDYERVNFANTFGQLPLWRDHVARGGRPEDVALDIGSGPGGFARRIRARRVYCLDPSRPMLRMASEGLGEGRYRFLAGLAESIPLRDGAVDAVYCSFSFRDFLDKRAAVCEMARVLRPGGRLHVLDATRPPPGWRRKFMDTWLNVGVPVVVRLLVPRRRQTWSEPPFASFVRTYEAMASAESCGDLLRREGFEDVGHKYLSMRSIFHLWGVRERTT